MNDDEVKQAGGLPRARAEPRYFRLRDHVRFYAFGEQALK
jgi:hypothetical protein